MQASKQSTRGSSEAIYSKQLACHTIILLLLLRLRLRLLFVTALSRNGVCSHFGLRLCTSAGPQQLDFDDARDLRCLYIYIYMLYIYIYTIYIYIYTHTWCVSSLHPVRHPRFGSFRTHSSENLSAAVKLPIKKRSLGNPTLGNKSWTANSCYAKWVYSNQSFLETGAVAELCSRNPHDQESGVDQFVDLPLSRGTHPEKLEHACVEPTRPPYFFFAEWAYGLFLYGQFSY